MSISRVSQLGYLGLEVRDVPAWELFGFIGCGLAKPRKTACNVRVSWPLTSRSRR
jgi:hypothetical protein